MAGEFDTDDPRFTALYIGEVVDREDPEGIGRVRVRIPGLVEPASSWAFPLGTVGGGSAQRGFFAVPEKGAEVGVFFHQGDVDHPYYLSGHWGKPDGKAEVPEPVKDLSKEDAPKVRAFETDRFLLVFDDRSGSEKLLLKDKATEDLILIEAATGIRIKTAKDVMVEVEGNVVVTAGGVEVFHLNKDGLELGEKPTDYMALAKLVKDELSALRDTVNSFVSTFNGHNHMVSGVATAGSPAAQTQTAPVTSAGPGSSATAPASVKDVASAFVKSK